MRKIIGILLTVLFTALLLYSGYEIYSIYNEYNETQNIYNDITGQVVSLRNAEDIEVIKIDKETSINKPKLDSTSKSVATVPITVDFDKLFEINPDIVGWIYCEDTVINYPIVQSDNNTYYLKHLFDGEHNKSGSLFMDCRCSSQFSDNNSIIYGHNMKDGSMFASIVGYQAQQYYDEHSVMYLLTPTKNYALNIFSGYITGSDSKSFSIGFNSESDYKEYLTAAIKNSNFRSNVRVTSKDKLITLSTCSYEFTNARYVVHAVLTTL